MQSIDYIGILNGMKKRWKMLYEFGEIDEDVYLLKIQVIDEIISEVNDYE